MRFFLTSVVLFIFALCTVAQPTITSFNPLSGAIGSSVTITGTNFNATPANNVVYFGGVKATVTTASTTSLTVTVPSGAAYAPITVTTANLTASSALSYAVTFIGGGVLDVNSFKSKETFSAATGASFITTADLNGDGKLDVVTANNNTATGTTISIYANTSTASTISFAPKIDFTTNLGPVYVATGDLDGDGLLDLAVANLGDGSNPGTTISVFRNTSSGGSISFAAKVDFTVANYPIKVQLCDLDGNGKLDMMVTGSNAGVGILRNTSAVGSLSFAAKVDFATGIGYTDAHLADLDGDNKADLIVANNGPSFNTPEVSLYRNTSTSGTISFAASVDYTTSATGASLTVADFDIDGKLDVGVLTSDFSIFRNTSSVGALSLATASTLTVGTFPGRTVVGDIDGDARPDIAIMEGNPNRLAIYRNTTTGSTISFAAKVSPDPSTYFTYLCIGDINADARPDILSTNDTNSQFFVFESMLTEPVLSSFTPQTAGVGTTVTLTGANFSTVTNVSFGGTAAASFTRVSPTTITAVVANGSSGNVSVTTSSGTASLAGFIFTHPPIVSSIAPAKAAVGATVVITGSNFSTVVADNHVYFGSIKATVTAASPTSLTVVVPAGASFESVAVRVNNLIAYSPQPFSVLFEGGGTLTGWSSELITLETSRDPRRLTSADLDGDGKADLLAISDNANVLTVFRNTSVLKSVSYATKQEFTTGASGPRQLAVGDINGDGLPDVAISHCCSNTVTIFINNSTPGNLLFQNKLDFTMDSAGEIALADVDGDGKLDLIINGGFSAQVYRNTTINNVISFAAGVNSSIGSSSGLALFDFDGDGKPDLASASYNDNTVTLLRNTSNPGTVSFAAKQDFATGVNPYALAVADIDGDNKLDIAVPNYGMFSGTTVSILLNNSTPGNLSFASKADTDVAQIGLIDIDAADLDGDGKVDLVVTTTASNFLLRNKSTPGVISFDDKINYLDFSEYVSLTDIDGDGKPDMTKVKGSTVLVRRNQLTEPQITLVSPLIAGTGEVVTITGNNFNNVTSVSFGGVPAASFTITSATSIAATVGSGATGNVTVNAPQGTSSKAGFIFYNGPSLLSFLPASGVPGTTVTLTGKKFSTTPSENIVRFGNTLAQVTEATATQLKVIVPSGATHAPISITTGGLTTVSSLMFTVSFAGGGTLSNTSYTSQAEVTTEANQDNMEAADIDGDGKMDLITVGTGSNTLSVFRNTSTAGTTSFAPKLNFSTGSTPVAAAVGDLDGDGKLDVAVTNSASNSVSVFLNTSTTGTISFAAKVDVSTSTNPQGIVIGDLDADGRLDIATANFTGSNIASLLRNTTSGPGVVSFAGKVDVTAGSFPSAVAIADLNNDRLPELLVANAAGNSVSVFLNASQSGTLSLINKADFPTGNFPTSITVGDVNPDGKLDVIVANSSSASVSVLRNQTIFVGTLVLAAKVDFSTNSNPNHVALGDVSGDGRPDIVVANAQTFDNKVSVLRNTGASSFAAKIDYAAGTEPVSTVICDLDNDGLIDLASLNRTAATVSVLRNTLSSFTSFAPSSAATGSTVTLTGTNFTGTTAVSFGGVAATSFTVVSPTTITAIVGAANSGNVSIVTLGGTLVLAGFNYLLPPTITSFTPSVGGPGSRITITGTNFNDVSAVSFGGTPASAYIVSSPTTMIATVGEGATGDVLVTASGGTTAKNGFTYDPLVTSLVEITNAFALEVSPNPVEDRTVHIVLSAAVRNERITVQFITAHGASTRWRESVYEENGVSVETPHSAGIYLLHVEAGGRQFVKRIVVQ